MNNPQDPNLTPPEPPTSPTGLPQSQSGWQTPQAPPQPPPGYQQQYQQQYPGQPMPSLPTNGKATAALVLGICGLLLCPLVLSVVALVLGYQARTEIDQSGGTQDGRGLAVAGIVLGWIGVVFAALVVLAVIAIAALDPSAFDETSSLVRTWRG